MSRNLSVTLSQVTLCVESTRKNMTATIWIVLVRCLQSTLRFPNVLWPWITLSTLATIIKSSELNRAKGLKLEAHIQFREPLAQRVSNKPALMMPINSMKKTKSRRCRLPSLLTYGAPKTIVAASQVHTRDRSGKPTTDPRKSRKRMSRDNCSVS